MPRHFFVFFVTGFLAFLSACGGPPDRAAADKKLEAACLAGIKALYSSEDSIEVVNRGFGSEKAHDGANLRKVTLGATYVQGGGAVELRDYACWFEETTGIMGYLPKFYRLEKDGEEYGNYDGTIRGGYAELLKLQQETEAVLN